MKITPEDMDAVREVLASHDMAYLYDEHLTTALALILVNIYDRGFTAGYEQGQEDAGNQEYFNQSPCPYMFAHTRHWCGHAGCRES